MVTLLYPQRAQREWLCAPEQTLTRSLRQACLLLPALLKRVYHSSVLTSP